MVCSMRSELENQRGGGLFEDEAGVGLLQVRRLVKAVGRLSGGVFFDCEAGDNLLRVRRLLEAVGGLGGRDIAVALV